ncbi:hypothetical protein KR018_011170 [Drosophila ironensis]|nr:hypothetical protein KR018_011170 [Drosophila ironensis]
MYRSVFLLLMAAFVLGVALARPEVHEEDSQEEDSLQLRSSESSQETEETLDWDGSRDNKIRKRNAADSSASSEETKEQSAQDASSEESPESPESLESSEEEDQKETLRRTYRSAVDERNRNLENLARICPTKQIEKLEEGSFLDKRIEIYDIYGICKDLPNRSG